MRTIQLLGVPDTALASKPATEADALVVALKIHRRIIPVRGRRPGPRRAQKPARRWLPPVLLEYLLTFDSTLRAASAR